MTLKAQLTFTRHKTLNKAKHIKCYLKPEQRRALIKETSDQASMLYEYYLNMVSIEDNVISDKKSAAYFGWTVDKAKRHRISLEKAGYFEVDRFRGVSPNGTVGCVYLIGKEAIADHSRKTKSSVQPLSDSRSAPSDRVGHNLDNFQ